MLPRRQRRPSHVIPDIGLAQFPKQVPVIYNLVANVKSKAGCAEIQTRLPAPRTRFRFRRFAQHRPPPQGEIVWEKAYPQLDLYPIGKCGAVKERKVVHLEDDFSDCFICFQNPSNRVYYEKQHRKIMGVSDPNTNKAVCFPGRTFRCIVQKKHGTGDPQVMLAFNICSCNNCMSKANLKSRQLAPVTVKLEITPGPESSATTLFLDFHPGCLKDYVLDNGYKENAEFIYFYYYGPLASEIVDGLTKLTAGVVHVPAEAPAAQAPVAQANRPNPPAPAGVNPPAYAVPPPRPAAPGVQAQGVRTPPTYCSPGHQRTIKILSITPKPMAAPCDFDYFRKIYDMKEESDVDVISSDDKLFPSHRIVLMTRCEAFARLLPHKTAAEGTTKRQTLKLDEEAGIVDAFLRFIYKNDTSKIESNLSVGVGCIRLANQYNIQDLVAVTCDLLINKIKDKEEKRMDHAYLYELYNYVHLINSVEIVVELKWVIVDKVRSGLLEEKNKRVKTDDSENLMTTTFGLPEDVQAFILDLMRKPNEE